MKKIALCIACIIIIVSLASCKSQIQCSEVIINLSSGEVIEGVKNHNDFTWNTGNPNVYLDIINVDKEEGILCKLINNSNHNILHDSQGHLFYKSGGEWQEEYTKYFSVELMEQLEKKEGREVAFSGWPSTYQFKEGQYKIVIGYELEEGGLVQQYNIEVEVTVR